jgi:hypothetical protein
VDDYICKLADTDTGIQVEEYQIKHISFDKYSMGYYATYHLNNGETVPHYLADNIWGTKSEMLDETAKLNQEAIQKVENALSA